MAKKKIKSNAFNTVTPFSKILALIMFVTFPFIGFYLGIQYQKGLETTNYSQPSVVNPQISVKPCTLDAKICPDGTTVGRVGPDCEFAKCPEK